MIVSEGLETFSQDLVATAQFAMIPGPFCTPVYSWRKSCSTHLEDQGD